MVKSTAIDAALFDAAGVFTMEGPARVFARERDAMNAIKSGTIQSGDVLVLAGCGPLGTGMEETYQLTSALKHLPFGKKVVLITDARFSGVSTGACIGHVGPEALAGGPIGRVRDGDRIRVVIDRVHLAGSVDLVGDADRRFSPTDGAAVLETRSMRDDLSPDPQLPDDTRLWAALQQIGGGTWGGCVFDVDAILDRLNAGNRAGR